VNLQWHDPRNEMSRYEKNRNENLSAQDLKLQEMSSELFGKERITNCSTNRPGADLLPTEADYLRTDSSLNPNLRQERHVPQPANAKGRFAQNLADSNLNTMPQANQAYPPPIEQNEDPSGGARRREEKNFSDIFETKMGERRVVNSREEVLGTRTCSFLDTRSEIAARNKEKWRVPQSDLQGTSLKERPNVSALRKEAERDSSLFDRVAPEKPQADADEAKTTGNERVCWDTKDIMQPQSELARRARLKDFSTDQSAEDRKWGDLASQQVRQGMGPEFDTSQPQFSPRGNGPRGGYRASDAWGRITDPRAPPAADGERPKSAKDTKLASLQSSIFG